MKKWLPAAILVAALFVKAVPTGNLVPSEGSGTWYFPLGETQTIFISPGLQGFFGALQVGISNVNYLLFSGNTAALAPIITAAGALKNIGLDIASKGASAVTIYPGTNQTSAFVVKNASQNVSELSVNTSNHVVNLIALNIASGTITNPSPGQLSIEKTSTSGSNVAPGASAVRFEVTCGFSAGTAALIAYAGTSTVSKVILDSIGSGFSGC